MRNNRFNFGWILPVLVSLWIFTTAHFVQAQSETSATDVPDRFVIEAGGAQLFFHTNLTLNSAALSGTTVNLENDLNLPDTTQQAYVEGFWRPARRHQLSLSYYRIDRTGTPTTVTRGFTWAGASYQIGASAVPATKSDALSAVYRWAAYSNSHVEFGPSIGLGYMWLNASIATTVSAGGPQGTASTTIDGDGNADTPTGGLGGFINWWLASRVYVRSDLRYILVKPNDERESMTQGRTSLTWYPWRHLGFGGQYTFDKFTADRTIRSTTLGGAYQYDGFQILASARF